MMSVGEAGNILIGQNLGAGEIGGAIKMRKITYIFAAIFTTMNITFVLMTHRWLPHIFSVADNALALTQNILLLSLVYSIFDGLNFVHNAIVKAW